jgi:lysozyme
MSVVPSLATQECEMFNGIIDIYHLNSFDIPKVKQAGIVAVIHKATQGTTFQDDKYHDRRAAAKAAGLLWGAYHFSTGQDVAAQVDNFLSYATPSDDELISLDWEPSDGPDMTAQQAREFAKLVWDKTGRWPVIYGGHLLRESVGNQPDPVLKNCPLWYVRYAPAPLGIPDAI